MSTVSKNDVTRVKGLGFLQNRGTDCFSGRIVPAGTIFSATELASLAELATRFSSGTITFTARQAAEVPGIPFDKIDEAIAFGAQHGLFFGGTGAKIRPVTACKGTTCVYGNFDTQALALALHENYYLGWSDVKLPHKFKIAVGGCPNSCMKPSLNDFGVEGHRIPVLQAEACRGCGVCQPQAACPVDALHMKHGKIALDENVCLTCGLCLGKCPFGVIPGDAPVMFQLYFGGTWGKHTRMGTPLSRLVAEEEIFPLLDKTLLWFRENAFIKERLGAAIDRLGVEVFEAAIFGDDLLLRKGEILNAPLRERA